MRISIESKDIDDLATLWDKAPEITKQELVRTMSEASEFLEGEVQDLTPVGASGGGGGGLKDSITAQEPKVLAHSVIGVVGTSVPYAIPVELGSRPHFPPVEPIKDWVIARLGIRDDAEATSVAYAIARTISIRGTKAVRMFHRAFAVHRSAVQRKFEHAVNRIADRLADI